MKKVYGYIRVSTAKQGEGVSLVAQKEAIMRYASQYNLTIVEWFEEKETAAKQGRPLFTKMMNLLKDRKAVGVVMHKIDRSARNLKDWADLGNLIDQGVEVHFAHESLDLQARGGRLSADIQAVIAADYIRNLRQEAIKGLYGRLNQGIYPFAAPTGYLNTGKGKVKTIDPIQGPLVRKAFELYATGKYSLDTLAQEMKTLGFLNTKKRYIRKTKLSEILHNPFYIGMICVKGQTFNGTHEPLISPELFYQVKAVLQGKTQQGGPKNSFKYRRLLKCSHCGYSLVGETQKGKIYYRCHTKNCPTKGVTERNTDAVILNTLRLVTIPSEEDAVLTDLMNNVEKEWAASKEKTKKQLLLQVANTKLSIEKLTDFYIEGDLDKETFYSKKQNLLLQLKTQEAHLNEISNNERVTFNRVREFLERAKNLIESYRIGFPEEQREILQSVTSNLKVEGKSLSISMQSPFFELSNRYNVPFGADYRTSLRKKKRGSVKDYNPPITFTSIYTSPIICEPLSRESLKQLLDFLVEFYGNPRNRMSD